MHKKILILLFINITILNFADKNIKSEINYIKNLYYNDYHNKNHIIILNSIIPGIGNRKLECEFYIFDTREELVPEELYKVINKYKLNFNENYLTKIITKQNSGPYQNYIEYLYDFDGNLIFCYSKVFDPNNYEINTKRLYIKNKELIKIIKDIPYELNPDKKDTVIQKEDLDYKDKIINKSNYYFELYNNLIKLEKIELE